MSIRPLAIAAVACSLGASAATAQVVICAEASRTFTLSTPVFPYRIDNTDSPILQLVEGNSYTFNGAALPTFHPLFLTADAFGGFGATSIPAGSVGGYTTGDTCGGCSRTSFTITPNAASLRSFYYQCHIHSNLGNLVQVLARPTIDDQPDNTVVQAGQTAMLMVAASTPDNATLAYQWRKGGVEIGGANGPMLSLDNASAANAGSYDCIVSNACARTTTQSATLTVACGLADVAGLGGAPGADGQLSVDDIVYYLGQFFNANVAVADIAGLGGSPGADLQITVDDLVLFLARFFAGC